jgi:hypothetical protein
MFMRTFLLAVFLVSPASAQMYAPPANAIIPGDSAGTAQNGCVLTQSAGGPICSQKQALQVGSIVFNGGAAPTIVAGAGAGTSPTISVTGALNSQLITLTTTCTVTCSGSSVVATITLPVSCPNQAVPVLAPGNINVAQLSGSGSVYVVPTALNTYTLNSSSTGLLASTTYKWNVHVDCW